MQAGDFSSSLIALFGNIWFHPDALENAIMNRMQNDKYRLLVINPGSTSTKVSLFENETSVFEKSLFHDASVLLAFPHVNDQMPFRRDVILGMLRDGCRQRLRDADAQFLGGGAGKGHHQHTGDVKRLLFSRDHADQPLGEGCRFA